MRIESLECFLHVSKTLNYSISACELHVTQSTISRTIKVLEDEFGCQLISTNKGKVSLTKEGSYLAEHLPNVLENFNQIKKEIDFMHQHQRHEINIGIVGFGEDKLHKAIFQMMTNDTEIKVHLCPVSIIDSISKVLSGELDCCTSFAQSMNHDLLGYVPIFKDTPRVYYHINHPFHRKKKVTVEDVNKYTTIAFDMKKTNIKDKILHSHKILLEMNKGHIVAPKNDNLDFAKNCESRVLDDCDAIIELGLFYLNTNNSLPLQKLMGYLKQE